MSPDAELRGLAAVALADRGDSASLTSIRQAASLESDASLRLSMARALMKLGDTTTGDQIRRSICLDGSAREDVRIQAADELLPDLDQPCALSVAHIVGTTDNDPMMLAGLSTLTRIRLKAAAKLGVETAIRDAITRSLTSTIDPVRIQAAKCATVLQVHGVLHAVQRALNKESNPEAKRVMQTALELLAP